MDNESPNRFKIRNIVLAVSLLAFASLFLPMIGFLVYLVMFYMGWAPGI